MKRKQCDHLTKQHQNEYIFKLGRMNQYHRNRTQNKNSELLQSHNYI